MFEVYYKYFLKMSFIKIGINFLLNDVVMFWYVFILIFCKRMLYNVVREYNELLYKILKYFFCLKKCGIYWLYKRKYG